MSRVTQPPDPSDRSHDPTATYGTGNGLNGYPPMPPPPEHQTAPFNPGAAGPPAPDELRAVVILLIVNVALSLALTVVTVVFRHRIVDFQLNHRHVTDPAQRASLRDGYVGSIIGRVVGNVVVSVVYVFLVRALLRGRRWAYRRVIWIGCAGIIGLILLQLTPYPAWLRVEQLTQAVVLAALVWFVTRPAVKAHFAAHLPGRQVRRFNR
jgi:hypothetical protein